MGPNRRTVKLSLLATFSVLMFLASIVVKSTLNYGAIAAAVVLLAGALSIRLPYAATVICFISGLLFIFTVSSIGPLMLGTFLVRGVVIDVLFSVFRVYRDASNRRYRLCVIIPAMVVSGFAAGLYQYFFLVLFMHRLVDFGAFIVSTIFVVSLISNAAAGYIVPKYVMPRVRRVI